MKKKFSLWLNIVTICLCVCAIAIGVYAATSASLTISGQIGFTAHGIDMDVTVHMYGHSTTADGEPIVEADKVSLVDEEDDTMPLTGNTTLSFTQPGQDGKCPPVYFSDMNDDLTGKPTDIYVVVTLKAGEDLKFDVMATASGTSADDSIIITPSAENTLIAYDDTTAKTITFKLSVQPNAQGGYDEILNTNTVSLNISLDKVSPKENVTVKAFGDEAATIRNSIFDVLNGDDFLAGGLDVSSLTQYLTYAERFPYYINFGKEKTTNADLRWLVVGVDEGNDVLSTLTEADKRALSAGYMIDGRNYYLLSENTLYTKDTSSYGLPFQNNYKYESSNTTTKYPNSQGVNANDYATSNIRAYLNGDTVKNSFTGSYTPSGDDVNFFTTYSFTDVEKALITPRKVTDLYKGLTVTSGVLSDMSDYEDVEDDFWLLSQTETKTLFGADENREYLGYVSAISTVQGTSKPCFWWLRSPDSDDASDAWCVYDSGDVFSDDDVSSAYGVRPAFKI